MKLKRLEITGFKSFRDKVVLDFSEGITAVVGPNGCGKSNIVDAMRWVMGEQRVKMLRGNKMDDVIFNGSQGAAPVGMAEVSMILLSADGHKFPGMYADMSEVTISRRIFRDGESEYCINKVPCRLLDVREFFMDTGVGAKAYSLVEQNSVAHLVEAKPEEKRQFIEEAAGISKYKSRKEAALRKIESTKQNLMRVSDIMREVKTQLNAASRQAKRAEQYKEAKRALKEAELGLTLAAHAEFLSKRSNLAASQAALKDREIEIRTEIESLKAAQEVLNVDILENAEVITRQQERLYDLRSQIGIKQQWLDFAQGKINDASVLKQRNSQEIESLRFKKSVVDAEIDALRRMERTSTEKIETARLGVIEGQQKAAELKKLEGEFQQRLDEKKVEYFDLATEKAKRKNLSAALTKDVDDLKKRDERNSREVLDNEKKRNEVVQKLETMKGKIASDEKSLKEIKERQQSALQEYERLKSKQQVLDGAIAATKEEMGSKSSRLHSLKEFQEGYLWCNEGTKFLMKSRKNDGHGLDGGGFLGLVADYIDVPKDYETAVEAVLGEKLQYIIVKSQEDGVKAIESLKNASLGRSSFIPIEVRTHASGGEIADHLRESVRLVERVNVHEEFKGIAHYLLDDVLLIPDLHKGIALWRQNGFIGTFVTPEGDIVNAHGVLTGGSKNMAGRGLFQKKRESAELEEALASLSASLSEKIQEKKEAASLIVQWEGELQRLRSALHSLELQINSEIKDGERFEDEMRRIEQRIKASHFDREYLGAEISEATGRIAAMADEITVYERRESLMVEEITAIQNQWNAIKKTLGEWEESLTSAKVSLAALQEKHEANLKVRARLEADLTSIAGEVEAKGKILADCDEQILQIESKMGAEQELLQAMYADYAAVEAALNEQKLRQQGKENTLKVQEAKIHELGRMLEQALKENNDVEMNSRQLAFHMDNLKKNVHAKYAVDLDALMLGFQMPDEVKMQALKTELEKNKETIENFGEVNLLAINEYEGLKGRYEFLNAQMSDLNASIDTLHRTIARINAISRRRFAKAFEEVNAHFKRVFPMIFPGGRGELRLTDEGGMLEAGIDIDIQISGKRAQNISLLSGGEKSLAAIALIFAVIFYNPAPFAIFDEVDAALDDANISLFNRIVGDISNRSQIIIVTHNKKTMEAAGSLFGVTMQEQGISTIVSVSLN
jgi:chromosome segregation protein